MQVILGPGGEHHRRCKGMRGLRRLGDALRGLAHVVDRACRRIPVLDRAAGCPRLGEKLDRLLHASRIVREAALAVDVQRQVRRVGDRGNMRNELVARVKNLLRVHHMKREQAGEGSRSRHPK